MLVSVQVQQRWNSGPGNYVFLRLMHQTLLKWEESRRFWIAGRNCSEVLGFQTLQPVLRNNDDELQVVRYGIPRQRTLMMFFCPENEIIFLMETRVRYATTLRIYIVIFGHAPCITPKGLTRIHTNVIGPQTFWDFERAQSFFFRVVTVIESGYPIYVHTEIQVPNSVKWFSKLQMY